MPARLTDKAKRYLRLLEEMGDHKSKRAIMDMVPVNQWSVVRWRKEVEGFKQTEEQIWERVQGRRERSAQVAEERPDHDSFVTEIDPLLAEWLTAFKVSEDRMKACEEVGIRWSAIKNRLAKDKEFARLYKEIEEERNAKAEDILFGQVKKGSISAAKAWLQAHDPRYSGKVQVSHEHSGTVRVEAGVVAERKRLWLQTFNGALSPPAIEGEVLDEDEEDAA